MDADIAPAVGHDAIHPYQVVVRAVDADGDPEDITVYIHVLEIEEPPKIDRVYVDGVDGSPSRLPTATNGPSLRWASTCPEMRRGSLLSSPIGSGTEPSNTVIPGSWTQIWIPVSLSIPTKAKFLYGSGPTYLAERNNEDIQPAVYTASDEDGDLIEWSLEGPDKDQFVIDTNIGTPLVLESTWDPEARLEFKEKDGFPDFENPEDENGDNVYEVTIVVKDSTVDKQGNPHKDELNVTVKVEDSTEDNEPGKLTITNRQPEVNTELEAGLIDPDIDDEDIEDAQKRATWQWYRAAAANGLPLILLVNPMKVQHVTATVSRRRLPNYTRIQQP